MRKFQIDSVAASVIELFALIVVGNSYQGGNPGPAVTAAAAAADCQGAGMEMSVVLFRFGQV